MSENGPEKENFLYFNFLSSILSFCLTDYEELIIASENVINPCRSSLVIVMTFCKHQLVPAAVSVSLMRLGLMLVRWQMSRALLSTLCWQPILWPRVYINNIHIQAPGTLILEQMLDVPLAENKSVLVISLLDTITGQSLIKSTHEI